VPEPPVLPALFPAFFIGVWLGVASLLSVLGGWRGLSEIYGAPDQFRLQPADRFRARSLQMRGFGVFPVNYGNCITIGITDQGLYLVPAAKREVLYGCVGLSSSGAALGRGFVFMAAWESRWNRSGGGTAPSWPGPDTQIQLMN
jgi:hypothetical protein